MQINIVDYSDKERKKLEDPTKSNKADLYWVAQSHDGASYVVCKRSLWIAIAKFPPLLVLPHFLFLSDPIIPCPVNMTG